MRPGARAIGVVVGAALGFGTLLGLSAAPASAAPASGARTETSTRRVLVFSLPQVSWEDLDTFADAVPNLRRFLDHAAVAGLTTRADQRATKLADGYLTLGAGTRTVGDPPTDGDALGVHEPFGTETAGEVFRQRTGRTVRRGIVALAMPRVIEANDSLLYGAEPGALAVALRDASVRRAVIANGDGRQPDTPASPSISTRRRQAALALVDPHGRLPAGTVDRSIVQGDRHAPYGVRLDNAAVLRAFDHQWRSRSVVLVEGSDLVRADAYRPFASAFHNDLLLRRALHHTDELFGRLLRAVDLRRDAVVLVGPAHPTREISLTVLGVRGPAFAPGLLRSATTRRSGFVQLVDVAPTILQMLHVAVPTSMEGRPVEVGASGGSAQDRFDLIVHSDEAAQFRDRIVGQVQTAFVAFTAALVAGTILIFGRKRPTLRTRRRLGGVASCVLGFVPAVFAARFLPLHEWGPVAYWAYLVVVSIALGLLYTRAGRDRPLDGLLLGLLVPIVLLLGDVVVGAPLQFNSALGYSPTVAGRFTGFSNPAYAIVAVCAVIAAPLLSQRIGGRRGAWIGVALLGVVVVIDGAPFWGSDVGGVLSMVPAFAVTAVLILGWRVRLRTIASSLLGLVVAVVGFAALDLARPSDQRTHLGRLVERVQERGIGDFLVILQRKLGDNLGSLRTSVWGVMLPIALVLGIWLWRRAPECLRTLDVCVPGLRVAGVGATIVAALGYALNDSGIAVPGVMIAIAIASVVFLLTRFEPPSEHAEPDDAQGERTMVGVPA